MIDVTCKQCRWKIAVTNREDAGQALLRHVRANHPLHPHPVEFAEKKLMYDIQRGRYGQDDIFGKLTPPIDPTKVDGATD